MTSVVRIWLCIVFTSFAWAGFASAQVSETYGDYRVFCSSALCTAETTVPTNGSTPRFAFLFERAPGSSALWSLALKTHAHLADRNRPLSFRIDGGAPVTLRSESAYAPYGDADQFYLFGSSIADTLINQLTAGGTVRFSFIDILGAPHDVEFSLSGLTASLLKIDDVQGKLGSPRRLARPSHLTPIEGGDGTDDHLALGVPEPVLMRHRAESACEDPDSEFLRSAEPVIAPLSDVATLYGVPCFVAAYNVGHRFYVHERGEIGGVTPQFFATFSQTFGWSGTDILVNADWDVATGLLSSFEKGRGLGDCGTAGEWSWDRYALKMTEFRAWDDCSRGRLPTDWPIVYSANP